MARARIVVFDAHGTLLEVHAAGLAPLLDAVPGVDPPRCCKPGPRVPALVTARFRCRPHEVAFVSPEARDAHGAARSGFCVHRLNHAGQPVEYRLDALAVPLSGRDVLPARLA